MYQLSRTVPVNEAGSVFLSRHDVWTGLMMKAQNALPYVPQMQKCDVIEQGDGWLLRDILLGVRSRISSGTAHAVSKLEGSFRSGGGQRYG